ncbi:MAG: type II toxin-antitoxin system RelE/ParE family toxin [Pseudomonadota bacterium]|nr:type II toxin-antitoxin system RelE/ParE family toxin [Pseudomonadota bacterium]
MPAFKRAYKKLHPDKKVKVDDAIRAIKEEPSLGQEEKGDLADIFVYKFKIDQQEILLAYEWSPRDTLLLALGVHENFYRNLKR